MRLTIRHETQHAYEPPAKRVSLRLKLFAPKTKAQTPKGWRVSVDGAKVDTMLVNGFGDAEALWFSEPDAETVTIIAEGEVETTDCAGVLGRLGIAPPGVYMRQTRLTRADGNIRALAAEAKGDDPLSRMHALSAAVYEAVLYRPGSTDRATTAADALALGAGVCQDMTHLFVSAARAAGVPARYVVGYLHDAEAPLSETHAWAEAHLDGLGWVGFDPTHQVCPTEAYVRLCAGLDADDAAPIRGSIQGTSEDRLTVSVEVAHAQSQQQ